MFSFTMSLASPPAGVEGSFQVREDLFRLSSKIVLAHEISRSIESDLAGDVDDLASRYFCDLRIAGCRLCKRFRVGEPERFLR